MTVVCFCLFYLRMAEALQLSCFIFCFFFWLSDWLWHRSPFYMAYNSLLSSLFHSFIYLLLKWQLVCLNIRLWNVWWWRELANTTARGTGRVAMFGSFSSILFYYFRFISHLAVAGVRIERDCFESRYTWLERLKLNFKIGWEERGELLDHVIAHCSRSLSFSWGFCLYRYPRYPIQSNNGS